MSGVPVIYRTTIKKKEVIVTDRSIVVKEPFRLLDITLSHVESLEIVETRRIFGLGCLIIILGLVALYEGFRPTYTPFGYVGVEPALGFLLFLVGVAAAWYGWKNRLLIKINTTRRTLKLRGGSEIKELHQAIRSRLQESA